VGLEGSNPLPEKKNRRGNVPEVGGQKPNTLVGASYGWRTLDYQGRHTAAGGGEE